MRVSREQADANREHIIETAALLFREKGFNGIGLNDLMQAAGLTRGGFYGHFASKQELTLLASQRALDENIGHWQKCAAKPQALRELVRFYLSDAHRNRSDRVCALATLGADVARGSPEIKTAFSEGIERFLEILMPLMEAEDALVSRQQAIATLSMMVGALLLSRATGKPSQAREIRHAVESSLVRQGPTDS